MEAQLGPEATKDLLNQIVSSTKNDIIIFMIVVLIILVLVAIPIYRMTIKRKKEQDDSDLNEKKLLIDVVKENTSAITSLKTTLDLNNTTMVELLQNIERNTTHARTNIATIITNQENTIKRIDKAIDESEKANDFINDERADLAKISDIKEQNIAISNKIDNLVQTTTQTQRNVEEVVGLSKDIVAKIDALDKKVQKNSKKKEESPTDGEET